MINWINCISNWETLEDFIWRMKHEAIPIKEKIKEKIRYFVKDKLLK